MSVVWILRIAFGLLTLGGAAVGLYGVYPGREHWVAPGLVLLIGCGLATIIMFMAPN